jgi:hypothetical protein
MEQLLQDGEARSLTLELTSQCLAALLLFLSLFPISDRILSGLFTVAAAPQPTCLVGLKSENLYNSVALVRERTIPTDCCRRS